MSEEVEGFRVVAQSLAKMGVRYMFGVVGIPVVEVAVAAQQEGIHYVGMYAAKITRQDCRVNFTN